MPGWTVTGFGSSDRVREFGQRSEENARLREQVADLSLDEAVLQDVVSETFPGPRSCKRVWPTWCKAAAPVSGGPVH